MKKKIILIFFNFILIVNSFSQVINNELIKNTSIGFMFGETYFSGDLSTYNGFQPAFSGYIEKSLDDNNITKLQFEILGGKFSAKRYFSGICDNPNHISSGGTQIVHDRVGEVFNAEFIELDINYLVNVSFLFRNLFEGINFNKEKENRRFFLFAKLGLGLNLFKTLRTEFQENIFVNSYGYEWNWENNFQNAGKNYMPWKESIRESTALYGIVFKYRLYKKTDIVFSATNRYGRHDKWDANTDGSKGDTYTFYSIGPLFKF